MKTIMIWDQVGEAPLCFGVFDGDYDYLDGVYLNSADADEDLSDELREIHPTASFEEEWPYDAVTGAYRVIRCGEFP